jgi:thiamine biosynthesis lipoprotein
VNAGKRGAGLESCILNESIDDVPIYVKMRRRLPFLLPVVFALVLCGCESRREAVIEGRTMGTAYTVKVVSDGFLDLPGLKAKIEDRLEQINRSMSNYVADSEISRFNRMDKAGVPFRVSKDFLRVMQVAEKIYRLSDGAWDATVKPLVDLWGFGAAKPPVDVPTPSAIERALRQVGFDQIEIRTGGYLVKRNPDVTLDFASIAKGYGVDALAELIRGEGIENFLVEIGGEVFAVGVKKDGSPWRVGVNMPRNEAPINQVYKVLALKDRALATSGDYRNFLEIGGRRYQHVVDPRTGYPVSNGLVSVSIEAADCTLADGLATALMVMGVEKGLDLLDDLEGVQGLIVEMQTDGSFVDYYSAGHRFFDVPAKTE